MAATLCVGTPEYRASGTRRQSVSVFIPTPERERLGGVKNYGQIFTPRQLLSYKDVMNAENAGAFFCPALLYYTPTLAKCNICIHLTRGVRTADIFASHISIKLVNF